MKYMITGAAGFIGSNILNRIKNLNQGVYCLDNMQTGKNENLGGERLWYWFDNIPKVDVIFHLGMPSSSPLYKESRWEVLEAMRSTIWAFEKAVEDKAKVIYASSSSLYNGFNPPHVETMIPDNKDWYTEARYYVERIARRYWEEFNVPSVGLRLFSVYGPRDAGKGKYANVVTQFALDMIKGKRPLIYGDGNQSRDFIHVDDVVNAFIGATEIDNMKANILNVGTGKAYSFNSAVDMINETLGTDIEPDYTKNKIHNYVFHTRASVTRMEFALGFRGRPFPEMFPNYVKQLKEEFG